MAGTRIEKPHEYSSFARGRQDSVREIPQQVLLASVPRRREFSIEHSNEKTHNANPRVVRIVFPEGDPLAQDFFLRLRDYYLKVAEVLRGEAEAATVFRNTTDIGASRERIYADFLRQHAPSKCNVFLGGFLFQADGSESRQLDIIVTTDTAPRYDFHNQDGGGKSFSPVEGTLAVASIKSTLDGAQLNRIARGAIHSLVDL